MHQAFGTVHECTLREHLATSRALFDSRHGMPEDPHEYWLSIMPPSNNHNQPYEPKNGDYPVAQCVNWGDSRGAVEMAARVFLSLRQIIHRRLRFDPSVPTR